MLQFGSSRFCLFFLCFLFFFTLFFFPAPDNYVNEAWFGVNKVAECPGLMLTDSKGVVSHRLNALTPRPVAQAIKGVYEGMGDLAPATCDAMSACWTCVTGKTEAAVALGGCNTECGLTLNHILVTYTADPSSLLVQVALDR